MKNRMITYLFPQILTVIVAAVILKLTEYRVRRWCMVQFFYENKLGEEGKNVNNNE